MRLNLGPNGELLEESGEMDGREYIRDKNGRLLRTVSPGYGGNEKLVLGKRGRRPRAVDEDD